MSRREKLDVHLDAEVYAELRELSAETRVPMSAIVRDVLPDALADWRRARGLVSTRLTEGE